MAETRKIAAILAADVVGFSRMTGTDEDQNVVTSVKSPLALSKIGVTDWIRPSSRQKM
jgi:class 3 adenylate cyclase